MNNEIKNWREVRFGNKNFFHIETGSTPSTKELRFWGGNIVWVTPKDLGKLNNSVINDSERHITDEGLRNSSAGLVPKDSIIISTRAPIGYLAIAGRELCFNQGCKAVVFNSKTIYIKFIYYFLLNAVKKLQDLGKGSTFKELSKTNLENFNVLLPFKNNQPDYEEQKRIADKIDKLYVELEKGSTTIKQISYDTNSILKTKMKEFFGNGSDGTNLETICEVFSGSSAPQQNHYFSESGRPFVRVSDLKNSKTDFLFQTRDRVNDLAIKDKRLVLAKKGTVLFPKSGAAILTNSRALLGIDAYIVGHLAALYPKDNVSSTYIYYAMCNIDMGNYIPNVGYPSLSLSTIKKIKIRIPMKGNVPNLREQERIVGKLNDIQHQTKLLFQTNNEQIGNFDKLKDSIFNYAFLGKL